MVNMKRAAIYSRISLDTEGKALGVARQEADCRDLAAKLGVEVVATYSDNDLGASTKSRSKHRPGFAAMLAAAEAGEFDVMLAYSNSRLTRRPMEFEKLIDLHERTGVTVSTVVSGSDDLSTADGRMVARIKANVDAAEAERISERVARKHLESARTGRPVSGSRAFGWEPDGVTIRPAEADLVRAAVADVLAGVPVARIAARWNADGVRTPRGNAWIGQTLRTTLLSPRLAGWRVHRGEVCLDATGTPVRGLWEPLITQEQHEAMKATLRRSERRARVPRKGARQYLLTGLIRCGTCNAPMYGNRQGASYFFYACRGVDHTNSISGPSVEELVEARILLRIAETEFNVTPPEFTGETRLAQIADQIAELMDAFNARRLSAAVVFGAVEKLETERDDLQTRRAAMASASGPKLAQLTPEHWVDWDTDRRRAAAELLLDAVLVRKPEKRLGTTFDASRVDLAWKA